MTIHSQMTIDDIFHFGNGRTVLVGLLSDDPKFIPRGQYQLWLDDEFCGFLEIEGEMISHGSTGSGSGRLRSVSTTDPLPFDREAIANKQAVLRMSAASSRREAQMHRHLLGVDSPPGDYIADPMTQGPVLPEGWDGDAWVKVGDKAYFLRAWNKKALRVAYGLGSTYEEARRSLLGDISNGTRRVEFSVRESSPG